MNNQICKLNFRNFRGTMFDRGERKTYFRSQLKGLRLRKLAECADFELSERENECKREKSSSFKMDLYAKFVNYYYNYRLMKIRICGFDGI